MAHFARLDAANVVTEVLVVDNAILGEPEDEQLGIQWLVDFDNLRGLEPAQWVQTSYNNNFRGKYAGIGMTYDPITDTFVSPETPDDTVPMIVPVEEDI